VEKTNPKATALTIAEVVEPIPVAPGAIGRRLPIEAVPIGKPLAAYRNFYMVEVMITLIVVLIIVFVLSLIGIFVRSRTLMNTSAVAMVILLTALLIEFGNFVAATTGVPASSVYTVFFITLVYIGILLLIAIG